MTSTGSNPPADIVVVGSVAVDSIHTPDGDAPDILGGAGTHFSLAASFFARVHLVGAIGEDFPEDFRKVLLEREIDLECLETIPDRPTFRWAGRYHDDPNQRDTLALELGAFDGWEPKVPDALRKMPYAFCATIHPTQQKRVLEAMSGARFKALDTIDHWITTGRDELIEALSLVDGVIINDAEARQLTNEPNLVGAARALGRLGPDTVVVKKGEHGALVLGTHEVTGARIFPLPAYPLENVVDPTGAGDSFAGGFIGSLAESCGDARDPTEDDIRRAAAYGTVLASFCVEGFGTTRVRNLTRKDIDHRFEALSAVVRIP